MKKKYNFHKYFNFNTNETISDLPELNQRHSDTYNIKEMIHYYSQMLYQLS